MNAAASESHEPSAVIPSRLNSVIWVAIALFVLTFAVFATYSINAVARHSHQIKVGMPQDEVEEILGTPYLHLPKGKNATGELLVWSDMFWQLDVVIGDEKQVLRYRLVPANSAFRRTQSKLSRLFH